MRLAEGIECNQAICARNGCCVIVLLFEKRGEPLQCFGKLAAIVFAERHEPVVINGGQEVIFIQLRSSGEEMYFTCPVLNCSRSCGCGNRRLKIKDIHNAGIIPPPLNGEMIANQGVAPGRQGSLEVVKKLP